MFNKFAKLYFEEQENKIIKVNSKLHIRSIGYLETSGCQEFWPSKQH